MNSRRTFRRRIAACTLAGSSFLMSLGCSTASTARHQPDHVFSTTTPQMLEREAQGQSVPVEASYPEESTTSSAPSSDSHVGVARLNSTPPDVREHMAVPVDPMRSSGRVPTGIQLVSWTPQADAAVECPPGFHPAEPRLECDPDGRPLVRMDTIAAAPTADVYPDEYVFDGGDAQSPASLHTAQRSGVESEDTVGGFVDHTGTARTSVSNRVAVYAPRFGSVSTVTGLNMDTKVEKASGARTSLAVGNFRTQNGAQQKIQGTVLHGVQNRQRVDGMNGAAEALAAADQIAPNQTHLVNKGQEGRRYSEALTSSRSQSSEIAQQMRNAFTWSRDQFPIIVASTESAGQLKATFKVEQTVGLEDERRTKGYLHIVKLADREAAQSGDVIQFTIRFVNTGDFDVYDVQIVDNLTPRLAYVEGSATIDENHPGEVTVEPNGEASSVLTFRLDHPLKGHASGVIRFEARVR